MSISSLEFRQDPPVPAFLIRDVLAKLAYVDERVQGAQISGSGDTIQLMLRAALGAGEVEALKARVATLVTAMSDGAFEPELRVLEAHEGQIKTDIDPMAELLARREVVQEGAGFFIIGPLLTHVVSYVEDRLLEIAGELGATPFRFPALIAPGYLERVQYFKNFPHSLSFATHLRENLPDIQRFSAEATTIGSRVEADPELFARPAAMLAPTVCHHLYLALSDTELEQDGIIATASGNCFRFESINMVSLERVWNFTMREIIFVGEDEQVRERLDNVRAAVRPLLEELGLAYKVMTANDPFFIGTFRDQAAYQAAFELKYEIRAELPYKKDTVAIGSYNRHGDFFGRSLNIRTPDGSPACTGCIGIGFERLALAFVAQHGLDPDNWPKPIRDAVAKAKARPFRFKPLASSHCPVC